MSESDEGSTLFFMDDIVFEMFMPPSVIQQRRDLTGSRWDDDIEGWIAWDFFLHVYVEQRGGARNRRIDFEICARSMGIKCLHATFMKSVARRDMESTMDKAPVLGKGCICQSCIITVIAAIGVCVKLEEFDRLMVLRW